MIANSIVECIRTRSVLQCPTRLRISLPEHRYEETHSGRFGCCVFFAAELLPRREPEVWKNRDSQAGIQPPVLGSGSRCPFLSSSSQCSEFCGGLLSRILLPRYSAVHSLPKKRF